MDLNPEETTQPTSDAEREARAVAKWLKRISHEKSEHEDFRDQADKAWKAAGLDDNDEVREYPLMWAVAQIEHSAVYSGSPIPDARSRSKDSDQVRRDAALVIQRVLEFYRDNTAFDDDVDRVVDDFLIAGLGVPRIKVDAEVVDLPVKDPVTGQDLIGEDGQPVTEPYIAHQMLRVEHVPWRRFGWEPCSNWAHCDWVYFEHELTRAEVKRRWPEAKGISNSPIKAGAKGTKPGDSKTCIVYEVWDKRNREVLVLTEGSDAFLEANPDPLKLQQFFPVPAPVMTNIQSDSLVPVPDYEFIEPLDLEITRLSKRATALTEQIKAASLHDASLIEIEDFTTIQDGQSIPVDNMAERMEGGPDLRKMMYFWPNDERVQALVQVNQQLVAKRQQVDDLLGLSDILRGASNPQDGQETQKIKERWAGIRLRRKQVQVQRMVRDLFRMMAELTVEHVTPENLVAMTQVQVTPEVMAILRSDLQRMFSVGIETDSTVAKDEYRDREARTQLLEALTGYAQFIAPAVNANQIPADLAKEMLQVAIDPYRRYSRGFDEVVDNLPTTQAQLAQGNQAMAQMQQQLAQMQQQVEQMTYALQQYSQAEERRQDTETQGKFAKDMASAQSTLAGIPDEQAGAGETKAATILKLAQADKVQAEARQPVQPQGGPV